MTLQIRDIEERDEARWRALWAGYNRFYGAQVPDEVTSHTWQRLLDPAVPMRGRVAQEDGVLSGFSLCVLHEGSWVRGPVCYLEDLFVDQNCRGRGIGRALIQDLTDLGRVEGWSRLYWHTQAGNPARKLYDSFIPADDFVRYRLTLQEG
ncbi:GNAT family N-acetyltransferase [Xanthobacter sp. TB0136]|uniref:GNAT family N-acetyltransferase n=1 Tax=Xanthobacter sp. TB0136 TaxID=3459177 RepID=UPI0040395F2D